MIHCGQCHYDLRGQSRESRCPECGFPISETLARLEERAIAIPHQRLNAIGLGLSLVILPVLSVAIFFGAAVIATQYLRGIPHALVLFQVGSVVAALLVFVGVAKCSVGCFSVPSAAIMLMLVGAVVATPLVDSLASWVPYLIVGLTIGIAVAMSSFLQGLSSIARLMNNDDALGTKLAAARGHFLAVAIASSALYLIGWPMAEWKTTIAGSLPFCGMAYVLLASLSLLLRFRMRLRHKIPEEHLEEIRLNGFAKPQPDAA